MKKSRKVLFNLILLSFSLIIACLIGEGLVRLLAPRQLVPRCNINDPEMAYRGKPNCSYKDERFAEYFIYDRVHNNYGFRMQEDIGTKAKKRVLCLGDSFTYGWGLPLNQSYFGLLQQAKPALEYINASYPGYGTGHCIKTLDRYAEDLDIDQVLYFFYFNDLFDNVNGDPNYSTHHWAKNENGEEKLTANLVYSPFKRSMHRLGILDWFYKHSHLFVLVKESIQKPIQHQRKGLRPPLETKDISAEQVQEMVDKSLAYLSLLVETCKQRQLPLKIIYTPCWNELPLENDMGWVNVFPFELFKQEAQTLLAENKKWVDWVDPSSCMQSKLADDLSSYGKYYFGEGHYNQDGHQLFYSCIEDSIHSTSNTW